MISLQPGIAPLDSALFDRQHIRPGIEIQHDIDLVVIACAVGVALAAVLLLVWRAKSRPQDGAWLLPGFVVFAQALSLCASWIVWETAAPEDLWRAMTLRYEFGWLAVIVGAVVLAAFTGKRRERVDWRVLVAMGGLLCIVGSQAMSAWIADIHPIPVIYVPILVVILTLSLFPLPMSKAVDLVLVTLGVICLVSLATIFFDTPWAQFGESRRIPAPFIEGRLNGLLTHPNVLAPLASIGLVLAATRRRWFDWWLAVPVFGLTLWLTDGRTQILITCLVLAGLAAVRVAQRFGRLWISRVAIGSTVAITLIATLVLGGGSDSSEVRSLNGRTQLWHDAVDYWHSSPVYGVGPAAFDVSYRLQSGHGWAFGAHNQILQTLAAEGIIGIVVLVITMMTFVAIAAAATGRRRAQLISVGSIALATMMVETPLWLELYPPQWFVFLSVLIVLFAARPDDADANSAPVRDASIHSM